MSEANNKNKSRPLSSSAVPVLFKLRNVQPAIFAGTIAAKPTDGTASVHSGKGPAMAASSSSPKTPSSGTITQNPTIAEAKTKSPSPEAPVTRTPNRVRNRIYNGSIALLVLVLLGLAVNNSRKNNSGTSDQLAAKPLSVESPMMLDAASTTSRNVSVKEDPSQPTLDFPTEPIGSNETPSNQLANASSFNQNSSTPNPSDKTSKASLAFGNSFSPVAATGPTSNPTPTPTLLNTSEMGAASSNTARLNPSAPQPNNAPLAGNTPLAESKPGAGNSEVPPNFAISSEMTASDPRNAHVASKAPSAIETKSPELNMSELLNAYQRAHSASTNAATVSTGPMSTSQGPAQVPYTPVSSVSQPQGPVYPSGPVPTQSANNVPSAGQFVQQPASQPAPLGGPVNPQILGGRAYPPMSSDSSSSPPAYEQNVQNNRMIGNPINPSDMTSATRTTSGSTTGNRYQGTLIQQPQSNTSTTKNTYPSIGTSSSVPPSSVPGGQGYVPLNNSIGYPPSNQ